MDEAGGFDDAERGGRSEITSGWRSTIERALGLEPDALNHDQQWAFETIRSIREIGNQRNKDATVEMSKVVAWLRGEAVRRAGRRAHQGHMWRLAEIEALEYAADVIERGEHMEDGDE